MPSRQHKIRTKTLPLTGAKADIPLEQLQHGMPALDSIHQITKFKGKYRIIKTTEVDSYEKSPTAMALKKALVGKQPSTAAVMSAMRATVSTGDNFGGTARKAAKLSIAQAPTEKFNDLRDLVAKLTPDDQMIHHKPKIPDTPNSNRVKEEMRNIHVTAFLYAASREADNDFHLIIGRHPNTTPETYMTMEVSGLPPQNSPAFTALNTARNAFKKFFGNNNLPGAGYHFYSPPIPVTIEGSLFFDVAHSTGQRPGPPSLKSRMPTVWEVHPITSIKLGP
jgi:hypothetical protein